MLDPRVSKQAKIIVDYSLNLKPGEEVVINATVEAIPLVREIVREIVEREAYPLLIRLDEESITEAFYKHAPRSVLTHVSTVEKEIIEKANASVSIIAPSHTKPLVDIDPEKLKIRAQARQELNKIFLERSARGELKWVVTIYPTKALAQEAGMSILEYEDFVFHALYADSPNPVEEWILIGRELSKIAEFLNKTRELRFQGPGIDLSLSVDGRRWISDDGRNNMPGGEVFTGPVEDSVEGFVEFEYPAIWRGVEVEGVKLVFRHGRVVEASARRGEEFLKKMINTDEGASRLGEIAFGLNYNITRHSKEILFDEKIGGTIHMALGASYPETGGRNISSIHWDLIKDMRKGRVYADGTLIYENGRFLIS